MAGNLLEAVLNCGCCGDDFPCCPGMSFPDTLHITLISMNDECGCLDGEIVPITLTGEIGGRYSYSGIWRGPCVLNGDPLRFLWFRFTTSCGAGDNFPRILIETILITNGDGTQPLPSDPRWVLEATYTASFGDCDPFYWYYPTLNNSPQNNIWDGCEETSMNTPWINLELSL